MLDLGELLVKIRADDSQLKTSLKGVEKQTQTTGKSIAQVAKEQGKTVNQVRSDVMKLAHEYRKQGMSMSDAMKQAYRDMGISAGNATTQMGGLFSNLGANIKTALAGAAVAGAAALGAALIKVGKDAMKAYADFEQLEGGVKKIFGKDTAKTVMANAQNAFRTAGISANEYMEQVTSFSASLLQSVSGDSAEAARVADVAITDMADNANTYGTAMEDLQHAYQGFAKQNYTMLDNLKLGYGGTRTEMQRLLTDAEKISGVHYDINNLRDVYEAIHVIQVETNISGYSVQDLSKKLKDMSLSEEEVAKVAEDMGTTSEEVYKKMKDGTLTVQDAQVLLGTTAREAATTISGSFNMMKSAWQNALVAIASGDTEKIKQSMSDLGLSIKTFLQNFIPLMKNTAMGIGKAIITTLSSINLKDVFNRLKQSLTDSLNSILPSLNAFFTSLRTRIPQMISDLVKAIPQAFNSLTNIVSGIFDKMINAVKSNGDSSKIANVGKNMITSLITGIQNAIPLIQAALPRIWDAILNFLSTTVEKLRTFVGEAQIKIGELFSKYFPVLIQKLASLVEKVPTLLQSLVQKITTKIQGLFAGDGQSKMASAGTKMLKGLAAGILKAIPVVLKMIPKLIAALIKLLFTLVASLFKLGGTIIKSFGKGLLSAVGTALGPFGKKIAETFGKIKDKVTEKVKSLLTAVKTIFNNIKSAITDRVTSAKDKVVSLFTKIKDGIKNKITSIPSTVKNIFSKVKDAITDKIEAARDKVRGIIEKIKGFFKFKVPKPNIPLPHFSITPAGWRVKDLLKGDIPHLGVSWYAKGGRFDEPALVPGLGDAGTEYALPLNRQSLAPLAQLLNELMLQDRRSAYVDDRPIIVYTTLEVDGRQIAKTTAPYMKNAIDRIDRADARQMGLV